MERTLYSLLLVKLARWSRCLRFPLLRWKTSESAAFTSRFYYLYLRETAVFFPLRNNYIFSGLIHMMRLIRSDRNLKLGFLPQLLISCVSSDCFGPFLLVVFLCGCLLSHLDESIKPYSLQSAWKHDIALTVDCPKWTHVSLSVEEKPLKGQLTKNKYTGFPLRPVVPAFEMSLINISAFSWIQYKRCTQKKSVAVCICSCLTIQRRLDCPACLLTSRLENDIMHRFGPDACSRLT